MYEENTNMGKLNVFAKNELFRLKMELLEFYDVRMSVIAIWTLKL